MAVECAFCGNTQGRIDKEHVWPEWIGRLLGATNVGPRMRVTLSRTERSARWIWVRQLGAIPAAVFVHTAKGRLQGQRQREFNKAWRSACRKAGYTGTLLHDLRRSGVRAMVRSGTPESVAMRISGHATNAVFKRCDIVSDLDLKEARDRRAQFGHNRGTQVIPLHRQVANK